MEYIINNKLRRVAYLKFLLFFLATIITIMVAAYFDVNLPTKENDRLKTELKSYENQIRAQQVFIGSIQAAKILTDSMNQLGQYNALLDQEIAGKLKTLQNPVYLDSSIYATMNKDVFYVLYDYYEVTKKLINLKGAEQQLEKLQNELDKCQRKLTEAEDRLEMYKKNSYPGL